MALALQMYTFLTQYLNSWAHSVPQEQKSPNPIKLGILSTAQINSAAVIHPISTHPEITLHGIASRNLSSAQSYASKYSIPNAYPSYAALLDDPEIDAVYISLPNAMHFEWACKALRKGKHVLLEKPFTSNAIEAKKLIDVAQKEGKVLLEAFHWQFHPAAHLFRSILNEPGAGRVLKTDSVMTATPGIPKGDIRWQYDLGGGSLMDMTYTLSFTRFALGGLKPEEVIHAHAERADDKRVDKAMKATLRFPCKKDGESVYSDIFTDLDRERVWGIVPRVWELPMIKVETENWEVVFYNAMMPHLYHYIQVKDKKTNQTRVEKAYAPRQGAGWEGWKGESWWSTYRYQLEAFVDKIKSRIPSHWIPYEESIAQMESIDMVYAKAGLPLRPTSAFVESV